MPIKLNWEGKWVVEGRQDIMLLLGYASLKGWRACVRDCLLPIHRGKRGRPWIYVADLLDWAKRFVKGSHYEKVRGSVLRVMHRPGKREKWPCSRGSVVGGNGPGDQRKC